MNSTTIENLIVPSNLASVSIVESLIDRVCANLDVSEDSYGNILIAVTEAVNNAVIHGNSFNTDSSVRVDVIQLDKQLCFCVSDEGKGFDYDNLPDPTAPENIEKESGRGIFLIRNLADDVIFDNGGSVVNLYFNRA
ncbi:MAG: ATP-binding protein [Crocinitomicaceae bacterium]|nr:ATP-binding protein [Crocinitomicaceae bacterium]